MNRYEERRAGRNTGNMGNNSAAAPAAAAGNAYERRRANRQNTVTNNVPASRTPSELKLEADKAKEKADALRREAAKKAASNAALYSTMGAGGAAAWAANLYDDKTEAQLVEYDSQYEDYMRQYYQAENEYKQRRMDSNTAATAQYNAAQTAEDDAKRLQALRLSQWGDTTGSTDTAYLEYLKTMQAEDTEYLTQKYGTSDLGEIAQLIEDSRQQASEALAGMGYNYDRMSDYEQRQKNAQQREQTQKTNRALVTDGAWSAAKANATTLFLSPLQGMDYLQAVGQKMHNLRYGDSDWRPTDTNTMNVTNYVQDIRQATGDVIEKNTDWTIGDQNVARFLYETGMSLGDSMTAVAMAGASPVSLSGLVKNPVLKKLLSNTGSGLLLNGSAASQTAKQVLENGGTEDQALWSGMAAGAAEMVFEKIGIDDLLKPRNVGSVKRLLTETLKHAGIEGLEEGGTEIVNILSNAVIMGQDSDYEQMVDYYISDGMTEDAAKKQAFLDCLGRVGWAVAGGFVSGGVMGGGVNAAQLSGNAYMAREIYGNDPDVLIQQTLAADQNNALAKKLQDRNAKGEYISGLQLSTLDEQRRNAVQKADKKAGETASLEHLSQKYGRQAGAMQKNYLPGQNVEEYDRAFRAAHSMAMSGYELNTVMQDERTQSLTESQREIAYKIGRQAEGAVAMPETVSEYEVSAEGKTIHKGTGEIVELGEVVSVDGGTMTFALSDGSTAVSTDLSYASQEEAELYAAVNRVANTAEDANALIGGFAGSGLSASEYANGIKWVFNHAKVNVPMKEIAANHYAKALPEEMMQVAYDAGRSLAEEHRARQEQRTPGKRKAGHKPGRVLWMDNKAAVSGETENTAEDGGVKYQARGAKGTDSDVVSIKEQITASQDVLNSMDPVANINVPDVGKMNIKQKRAWAEKELQKSGYQIDRQGFGVINFNPSQINKGLNYLDNEGEIAAFAALPRVLKRGIVIYDNANHKGRNFPSVTIAAPVVINGVRGNMAVVVQKTKGNNYHMHRILMPDGSAFVFENKKDAASKPAGALSRRDTLSEPIATASDTSISDTAQKSNRKNSLRNQTGGSEEVRTFREQTVASGRVLTDIQEKSIFGMERLAALLGIDMYVYESYMKDGERVYIDENGKEVKAPNGYYRNGKIYVDLNAGDYGEGTMLYTVSHEVVHLIRQWNPAKFHVLADCVVEGLSAKGESISRLIEDQRVKARRSGDELSFDDAYEEMIADALEGMLADGSVIEVMAEIRQRDKTLWEKIRDFFADLLEDLKMMVEAYSGYEPNSKEGKMVAEMQDLADKLQPIFAEAALEAADNYNAAAVSGETKNTAEDGGVKYQIREIGNSGKFYVQADRQVISGDDPVTWSRQVAKYINEEIRKGEDIAIPTSDGHVLLLTGRSSYKLTDRQVSAINNKIKQLLPDEQYALKVRAASHIDELIQVAGFNGYSPDVDHKHKNDIGEDGFNYFEAYFRDFDGKYYQIPFSAGINGDEETAYSIGRIRERRPPAGTGSSSDGRRSKDGRKPSGNSIRSGKAESQEKTVMQIAFEKAQQEKEQREKTKQKNSLRTPRLSDQEVLRRAAEDIELEGLTDGERYALKTFRQRLEKLRELQEQRSEQGKLYHRYQFSEERNHEEAKKTLNRMHILDSQIEAAQKSLLEIQKSKALQGVLRKRGVIEENERERTRTEVRLQEKAKRDKLVADYRESREEAVKSRKKTAQRHKVQRIVKELNDLLLKGGKEKHVPEELQTAVADALAMLDMDTVGAAERIARYDALIAEATDPDVVEALTATRDRIATAGEKLSEKLDKLQLGYDRIRESADPDLAASFDENVSAQIKHVRETVGKTALRDMSRAQLEDVYDMYKMILTTVRDANKAFKDDKARSIQELRGRVMSELTSQKQREKLKLKGVDRVNAFFWNNMKPVYAFDRMGSSTLSELYENIRSGEDVWVRDISEAIAFRLEAEQQYHVDDWDTKTVYEFDAGGGKTVKLNLWQIMSLYAYSKREQAADHIREGGIVIDEETEIRKKIFAGIDLKHQDVSATAYSISDITLQEMLSKLTDEQRAFADTMQDYLSMNMGAKGNEVSMKLYGVRLFKERHYFPLHSAPQYMAKVREQQDKTARLKNSGFTQATVENAANPIVLTGFMETWADHVNEMSMYHGFTLPMEDFYRVYNYSVKGEHGQEGIAAALQNAHGRAAAEYVEQLLKDLNGGAVADPRENTAKVMVGKFKKAAVFASASVVIQQPSSIARAFALVDPKHFVPEKIGGDVHKETWAEVKKYAPVAVIKEMGYFDTNMGRSSRDFLLAKEYGTWQEKLEGVLRDSNYRDEMISKAPALADELAWCAIWKAVKREQALANPSMMTSSDAFLELCGKRFTEVITKTQVYDSVLARSGNMRAKGVFMNMLTAFGAEPTTSVNMMEQAARRFVQGDRRGAARISGAVLGSIVLNSLLVSLVYAMRDDDEESTFGEKYFANVCTELVDGINPLTYYPIIKDVWSIAQGYDVERADMSLISDLIGAMTRTAQLIGKDTSGMDAEELEEHQKKIGDSWWSVADYALAMVGVPLKNVRREVVAMKNVFKAVTDGKAAPESNWGIKVDKAWDAVKNNLPVIGWMPEEQKQDKLYLAIKEGNEVYAERLRESYDSKSALDAAIRKALRQNDPRIHEAAVAYVSEDYELYKRIYGRIIGEGDFSQNDIVKAIKAEIDALTPDEVSEGTSAEKLQGLFNEEAYINAALSGRSGVAETIRQDVIANYVANGKTDEDAEKSFLSKTRNAIRSGVEDGDISTDDAYTLFTLYAGMDQADAAEEVYVLEFRREHPELEDVDVSKASIIGYGAYAEPAGIGTEIFFEAWEVYNNTDADYRENGSAIRNSAVRKMMTYINGLPLSASQKTALALCWYAESTVRKNKLW